MTETRTVIILDNLKQRACAGEPGMSFNDFLRTVTLNWDGRREPTTSYIQDMQSFYPVSVWHKTDGTMESSEDMLCEAESNGLNDGLQEERQGYRDELGIKEEAE